MAIKPSFIFDIDDTVYDQMAPYRQAFEEVFPHLQETVALEELYKKTRHFSDLVFEKTERGEMSVWEMRVYRIVRAFQSFGIQITKEEGLAFEESYGRFLGQIEVLPAIQAVFELCLTQDITLGVITNGPTPRQEAKLQRLKIARWIPQEHWFISGSLHLMKPDVRLFHQVETALDLVPQTTYYIGDSFDNDVVGAKGAGWQSIWLNHRQRPVPEAATVKADYQLADPGELLAHIQRIITDIIK